MEPEPIRPTLAYGTSNSFGWRESDDELVLVLPPRPMWEIAAESTTIIMASTGFLLIYGAVAYYFGRELPANSPTLRAMLVLVGLLAIGQWVLVVLRVASILRSPRYPGLITVTPEGLGASNALTPGLQGAWWPRDDIASLRLDRVRGIIGRVPQVRLQVATHAGTVIAHTFAWPAETPTEPYARRLRESLGLQDRSASSLP